MECPRCGTEYVYCEVLYCPRCKETKDDFTNKITEFKRKVQNYTHNMETTRRIVEDAMKVIKYSESQPED